LLIECIDLQSRWYVAFHHYFNPHLNTYSCICFQNKKSTRKHIEDTERGAGGGRRKGREGDVRKKKRGRGRGGGRRGRRGGGREKKEGHGVLGWERGREKGRREIDRKREKKSHPHMYLPPFFCVPFL
jgi:hypothetical protein